MLCGELPVSVLLSPNSTTDININKLHGAVELSWSWNFVSLQTLKVHCRVY